MSWENSVLDHEILLTKIYEFHKGAKPSQGSSDFMNKIEQIYAVPPSPTRCKNEAKRYTITLLQVIVVTQEEGEIIIMHRIKEHWYRIPRNIYFMFLSLFWMYCML